MPGHALTGSRIRERRLGLGLKQTQLAAQVGISGSYLNLIEHDARRIGGRLLNDIARALKVDPAVLSEAAEEALILNLRTAAAAYPVLGPDLAPAEEFANRFRGWAALVAEQAQHIALLEQRVSELTDRLTHDPQLAATLHQMISAVTSIRSAASILASGQDMNRDWQARFQRNINEDSIRLAESSRMLVGYLEGPGEAASIPRTPLEEVERFADSLAHHVPALEGGDDVAAVLAGSGLEGAAASLGRDWLMRYRGDVVALPLAAFAQEARACSYDPSVLAERFQSDLATVLRRLATLPGDHPAMGLAICNASGAIAHLRKVADFELPRAGAACALWPLYQALAQPFHPLRAIVALPGARAPRFLCYAVAQTTGPARFDAPPQIEATMLVIPDPAPEAGGPRPVGINCRICPRDACPARREPSILSNGQQL